MWVAVVLALTVWYAWWHSGRRLRALTANLPGWPTLPLIGNLHQLYGDSAHAFNKLVEASELAEETDSMVKVWFGTQLAYVLTKPEDIKQVTNAFLGKPYLYGFAREWVAEGLVTASVPVWKRHIKKVAPTFAASVVEGFLGVFNEQTRRLADQLREQCGSGPFEAFHRYLAPTTLETVCQTALGVSDITESIVTSEYMQAFNEVLRLMLERGWNILLHPDCVYHLTPAYKRFRHCIRILHNVSETVIKKRRQQAREKADTKGQSELKSETGGRSFKAFLDLLLELSREEGEEGAFTDEELRAEVDTIIVGGQETTASTLQFALLLLGAHPHVQDAVCAELRSVFGSSGRPVRLEDLPLLRYTEATLRETLRLYPPAPAVMRLADRDLQLEGYVVARGALCVVSAWGAGRSRRRWGADAEEFRPQRWLDAPPPDHPAAFVPFSYGRRACIGKTYAMTLLKIALANTLRSLEFRTEGDLSQLRLRVDVVLRPTQGHLLTVHPRIWN